TCVRVRSHRSRCARTFAKPSSARSCTSPPCARTCSESSPQGESRFRVRDQRALGIPSRGLNYRGLGASDGSGLPRAIQSDLPRVAALRLDQLSCQRTSRQNPHRNEETSSSELGQTILPDDRGGACQVPSPRWSRDRFLRTCLTSPTPAAA